MPIMLTRRDVLSPCPLDATPGSNNWVMTDAEHKVPRTPQQSLILQSDNKMASAVESKDTEQWKIQRRKTTNGRNIWVFLNTSSAPGTEDTGETKQRGLGPPPRGWRLTKVSAMEKKLGERRKIWDRVLGDSWATAAGRSQQLTAPFLRRGNLSWALNDKKEPSLNPSTYPSNTTFGGKRMTDGKVRRSDIVSKLIVIYVKFI